MTEFQDFGFRILLEGESSFDTATRNISLSLENLNRRIIEYGDVTSKNFRSAEEVATRAILSQNVAILKLQEALAAAAKSESDDATATKANVESKLKLAESTLAINRVQADYARQLKEQFQAEEKVAAEEQKLIQIQKELNAASNARVEAIAREQAAMASGQSGEAARTGLSQYIGLITATRAAQNLLNIEMAQTGGNIAMLGIAFGRLTGPVGLALTAITLGVIGFINITVDGFQKIEAVVTKSAQVLVTGIAAIGAALVTAGVEAVKLAMPYENSFAIIQAITGVSRDRLLELDATITNLIPKTTKGFNDIAQAAAELSFAGVSFDNINKGVLAAVVSFQMASNEQITLAQAARTVAVGLNVFDISAENSTRVTNALTAAAQLSALTYGEVVTAFRNSAPAASLAGISIEDLAAVIALLGNNSLKGTQAGTAFKQVLLDLEKPSKQASELLNQYNISLFDTAGKLRPIRDLINDMNKAFGEQAVAEGKVTDQQRLHAEGVIFGARAGLAANIITREGVKAFDDLKASMQNVTATNIADILLLPLNSRMEILKNTAGSLANQFGQALLPAISNIINEGIKLLSTLKPELFFTLGQAVVSIATGQGFGALQDKINDLTESSPRLGVAITGFLNILRNIREAITSQILPALQEFIDKVFGVSSTSDKLEDLNKVFTKIAFSIRVAAEVIALTIGAFGDLIVSIRSNEKALTDLQNRVASFITIELVRLGAGLILLAAPVIFVIKLFDNIVATLKIVSDAITNFGKIWELIWNNMPKIVITAAEHIIGPIGIILEAEEKLTDNKVAKSWANIWDFIGNAVAKAAGFILDRIKEIGNATGILANVPGAPSFLEEYSKALEKLSTVAKFSLNIGTGGLVSGMETISETVTKIGELKTELATIGEGVKNTPNPLSVIDDLLGSLPSKFGDLRDSIAQAMDRLKDSGDDAETAAGKYDNAGNSASKLANEIRAINNAGREAIASAEAAVRDFDTSLSLIASKTDEKLKDANKEFKETIAEMDRTNQQRKDDLASDNAFRDKQKRDREDFAKDQKGEQDDLKETQEIEDNLLNESIRHNQDAQKEKRRDAEEAFKETIDRLQRQHQAEVANANAAISAANSAAARGLSERQSLEEKQLARSFESENKRLKLQEDLAAATSPEDRARIQKRFDQEQRDQARTDAQNAQMDALRKRHEQEQESLRQAQQAAEIASRNAQAEREAAFRAGILKQERANQRALDAEDEAEKDANEKLKQDQKNRHTIATLALQRRQKDESQHFEDFQADEQEQHNEDRIDRNTKYAKDKLEERLRDKVEKIEAQEIQETKSAFEHLNNRLNDIKEAFNTKIPGLIEQGGEAVRPAINHWVTIIATAVEEIGTAAGLAQAKLNALIQAAAIIAIGGSDSSSSETVPEEASFAGGGLVKGRFGQATRVIAHAGERILSLEETNAFDRMFASRASFLTSVRLAQQTGSSNVNNYNATYAVNAHYANIQSEASVAMDMQALVLMSRR